MLVLSINDTNKLFLRSPALESVSSLNFVHLACTLKLMYDLDRLLHLFYRRQVLQSARHIFLLIAAEKL